MNLRLVIQLRILAGMLALAVGAAAASVSFAQTPRAKPPTTAAPTQDPAQQAAALFEAGQQAHQRGELEKAIALYGEALKLDPELWQAEYQRGTAYVSLNKLAEAKTSLTRVSQLLKDFGDSPQAKQISARVQTSLGEVALAENKADEAEQAFRRALELQPQAARAQAGLAEALLARNQHAEAINAAKAALAAGDDRPSTYALLGIAQTISRQFTDALPNLNAALQREPNNTLALLYRADVFQAQNRLPDAIADLRAAAQSDARTGTKLRLAGALAHAKRFDEALKHYQDVLQAEPENQEALTARAALLIESGKGQEAITQLEALLKTDPNRAALHAQLAELYLPSKPELALEHYQAAARLEPQQPNHQIGVASALVKLRKFQEAVAVLRPLTGQNLREDLAYVATTNLATALFELDDFPNAARVFVRVLEFQQRRGDQKRAAITLYFLGICFDKLGDLEQALRAYEQFLSLASPENQLEVEKVKLRMPSLQRQLKEGKGKKKP